MTLSLNRHRTPERNIQGKEELLLLVHGFRPDGTYLSLLSLAMARTACALQRLEGGCKGVRVVDSLNSFRTPYRCENRARS